jgi:hypothetical protein
VTTISLTSGAAVAAAAALVGLAAWAIAGPVDPRARTTASSEPPQKYLRFEITVGSSP